MSGRERKRPREEALVAREGSPERKKSTKKSRNKDKGGKSSKKKAVEKKPPAPPFVEEELQCIICFEFPTKEIFQCQNGHLLCSSCHFEVLQSEKVQCPSCRVKMSRDNPSRNRFAEVVLASHEVECTHSTCEQKLKFKDLKMHVESVCVHRKVSCKYEVIFSSFISKHFI